ncbi:MULTISPECIES: LysR family transcriptional regulator [unclassified Burkholderia]|uniref:LysR family transcriptional regulator n=1 Tax=unclassified Burkholderia TaxID=2613784 RepID=UPI0005CDFE52|nr:MULTISPECIES: LysR family transcriptional regulator [unclassified Burkholderia]TGN98713.1 LysR family transcriptional regulator [Burkholderia sp. USMB20]
MSLTRFSLRQIETFVCVADLHSFAGAAQRLGMTPQAVSQLIAELETTLSFRLFDRTTRRVSLSTAGRDFLTSAETIMRHVRAAESAADDVRNRAAGVVRIGAPLVLASTALPAAIREYQATRPKVVVRIRDLPVDALVDAVSVGDVDLAIGPDRIVGDTVERQVLFDSLWVFWCAKSHPLAKRKVLRWRDLMGTALVAAGRDHEHSVSQMRLSTPEGERVTPIDVVDNISTALGIAGEGLAATLAPAYVGALAPAFNLVMKRVIDPEVLRKVCLYRSSQRAASPAVDGFAEFLCTKLADWSRQFRQPETGA